MAPIRQALFTRHWASRKQLRLRTGCNASLDFLSDGDNAHNVLCDGLRGERANEKSRTIQAQRALHGA